MSDQHANTSTLEASSRPGLDDFGFRTGSAVDSYRGVETKRSNKEVAQAAACSDSTQAILSQLLVAEQIAMTLYFKALSSEAVVSHPYLVGASGSLKQVASDGNPTNVASMQAALDQERQHAALLVARGARSPHRSYYFPAPTFTKLGYTSETNSFLWVMDRIETILVGAYLSAVTQFAPKADATLTQLAARILGTEAQHRVLGRLVAGDTPSDNLSLEVVSFNCVRDVHDALQPYISGKGWKAGATKAIPIPSNTAIGAVVGAHRSH